MVAASSSQAAKLAGQAGDGLISTVPEAEIVQAFQQAGGAGKPRYAQLTVCWAKDEASARKTAYEIWPNAGLAGGLSQELATPAHFEQATKLVHEEDLAKKVICGPDPQKYIEGIQKYVDAGFDHIYIHQVGPDQEGFLRFYKQQILPKF
jgi:coenzyme F420-dependent glucose-6-phosphate dehydrogenase